MKIQTFTIVAGSEACNARCPYCVSRMTPDYDMDVALPEVNWRNFRIACRFAKDSGVTTVLLTGKGEPTLFPEQLGTFLQALAPFSFPFVELQTNGIALARAKPVTPQHLAQWYESGLTLIALSIVHWQPDRNQAIFTPNGSYFDLVELLDQLHEVGFAVRLSVTMVEGYVDSPRTVVELTRFAKQHGVEQLTVRPITRPAASEDAQTAEWVDRHALDPGAIDELRAFLDQRGNRVMELVHGAIVYDLAGQNICLTSCLTTEPDEQTLRQLIFFPDGHLRYDWKYAGAILL